MVCMVDNAGRAVAEWLPYLQSSAFLRASISKGERTAECWAEIAVRTARLRAALEAADKTRLQAASSESPETPVQPEGGRRPDRPAAPKPPTTTQHAPRPAPAPP